MCLYFPCVLTRCSGFFPSLSPDEWEYHMNEVLSEVYKQIPKVFVNLILIGNISEVPINVLLLALIQN